MAISREAKESKLVQGADEQIAYLLTTTPWGTSPTSIEVKCFDVTRGIRTDVSSTCLSGSASAAGDIITTPLVKSLTPDSVYRVEVKFTCSGNIFEAYFIIEAEQ